MKFNKNKCIGKQIQLFPSDAFEKYGIIEEVMTLVSGLRLHNQNLRITRKGKFISSLMPERWLLKL